MIVSVVAAAGLAGMILLSLVFKVILQTITDNAERRIANVEEDRRALTAAFVAAGGSFPAARIAEGRERPERPLPPVIEGL